jgi:16S rRNA G966 N2-methylase RsmD
MLDQEALQHLATDINERGLLNPITLLPDGTLLDGRNRLAACTLADTAPTFTTYDGDDPIGFVVSVNVRRRHLTEGQLSFLALEVEAQYAKQTSVGRPNKNIEIIAPGQELPPRQKTSSYKAAKSVGVGGRSVSRAKALQKAANSDKDVQPIVEAVKAGTLPLKTGEAQAKRIVKQKEEQNARTIVMADVPADAHGERWRMYVGDFRERIKEIPDASVDLILTDPPYPEEFQHLWTDLAVHAKRVLTPQGILVGLSGKIQLPQVMTRLAEHLNYGWIYSQPLPGSHSRIMARHTLQAWKPWLAYSNGTWPSGRIDWHPDVLDPSARAKGNYRWQQDPDPARMLIDALCPEGGTVLDPFTGTGSYGVVTIEMGRKFIGIEADTNRFDQTVNRLQDPKWIE